MMKLAGKQACLSRTLRLHTSVLCGVCAIYVEAGETGIIAYQLFCFFLGTTRSHLQSSVLGVSEGHICILSLVGVGYRASVEPTATTVESEYPGQQFVSLKVGFSHPVELGVPQGVKASTPQPTRILLEGINKAVVTKFAAEIREWRRPEPYKGKGIFLNGETIRLKAKKIR